MSVLGRPYYGTVFTGTSDASDYFVATFVSGVAYSITLGGGIGLGAPFPAGNDLDLYVYAVGGAPPVAQSNFTGFLAEEVRYVAPASGDYYLRAYGFRTPGGPVPYRIEARVVP